MNSRILMPKVVRHLQRGAIHRGSDGRLADGVLRYPREWPRRSIDASRWKWKICLSYRMTTAHINVLELAAILATLKWRTRRKGSVGVRFLHLTDSQVCMSVLCKGRSSSNQLNRVLSRINALNLVTDILPAYVYIRSAENPADEPSRWDVLQRW